MDFDAIVVGSGFGGTVAATLLAAKRKRVLMLERGTWWISPETLGKPPAPPPGRKPMPAWLKDQDQPVQYWPRPDHTEGLLDLFASVHGHANPDGLYRVSIFDQAAIITASAVGGGSMIYSNVTIAPPADVLTEIGLSLSDADLAAGTAWMADFRGPLNRVVTKVPLPGRDVSSLGEDDYLYLDRSRALRDAAGQVATSRGTTLPWEPLDLSVIEYDPDRGATSAAQKNHTFCERQGRCVLGCLPAARETLNKVLYARLLSDPGSGVALSPQAEVTRLVSVGGGYRVTFEDHRDGGEEKSATAPMVFLAGGVLGTTELLLRTRERGDLALSDAVGTRFSTNGDFGAFAVGTAAAVNSTRGPINTSHVRTVVDGTHLTVEDCAIPGMFAQIASVGLGVLDNAVKRGLFRAKLRLAWLAHAMPDLRDFLPHLPDTFDPADARTESERVANIFFFNGMGQDDASGRFRLDGDDLTLEWDRKIRDHPTFARVDALCRELATAMGGEYVPFWDALPGGRLAIPHPLGGCPIGESAADGAVDALGRVFDAGSADRRGVHEGLFVVDGSAIPGALSVNPTLTITAQAHKAVTAALAG